MTVSLLLALQMGALAGLGPCGLSRALTLRTLVRASSPTRRRCCMWGFVGGLVAGYVTFGAASIALGAAINASPIPYALAAAACAISGVATILGTHDRDEARVCRHALGYGRSAFTVGAATSVLGSPCCGPLAAALAGTAIAPASRAVAIELLAAYALGHCIPLVTSIVVGREMHWQLNDAFRRFCETVAGGLFIGLGGYYAMLI